MEPSRLTSVGQKRHSKHFAQVQFFAGTHDT